MQRHLFRGLRVAQQGGDAAPGFSVIPFAGGLGRVEGVGRRHGDQHHGVGGGYGADDVDVTLAQGQLVGGKHDERLTVAYAARVIQQSVDVAAV